MSIIVPILTELKSDGIDKAINQFKQLEGAGAKAQFAIKKAAVPAAAALGGLAAVLGDAVKGAMEDQHAQVALAQQLRTTVNATDEQIAANEKWITKMGQVYGVADDQLRPALGKLVRATGDVTRAQQLASLANDISAATGKDLESVSTALAKAQNGQYTALKKLGVPLGENTLALIEMAKESKKVQKAQLEYNAALESGDKKRIAKELENLTKAQAALNSVTVEGADWTTDLGKAFDGAADAAAATAEGGMKRFTLAMSEAKENIGAALLPAVEKLMIPLSALGAWAQTHTTTFLVIAGVIGGIAAAVIAVNTAMKIWEAGTKIWTALQWAWNAAMTANPIGLIVVGIAALVAGLVLAYKHFEGFRNVVDAVGAAIKTGFLFAISVVKTEVDALYAVFKFLFNGIATMWNNTIGKLHFSIPSWVPLIGGKGFDVPDIPMLADGGIVTGPTLAMIGERGPEAVIPLSKAGGSVGGGGVTIHVNGGDPQAVVDALRRFYRQNGPLPIGVAY